LRRQAGTHEPDMRKQRARNRRIGLPRVGISLAPRGHRGNRSNLQELSMIINLVVWLVVGGILGWIASLVMRTDAQQGIVLNVIVGIVGAAIAGLLISPLIGVPTINQNAFSVGALLVSLIGAIVLLAIVNLFRRGRTR
jgi:uncharacterized membrane protein YeaQ/YmgE (transglycosylase-associated protein family)